ASADMVAKALAIGGPCVGFARGHFEALPFRDACFAEIFSMEAIYYAVDLDAALAEIHRVLRPGGRVYLALDYFRENAYSHSWPEDLDVAMQLLGEAEWQQRLEQHGFAVEDRFRCLDPRPAPADASDERRREIEDFRGKIGSLALIAQRPAGGR
ncbi:MAG: methyltransferase domain-containing protein, partial [Planctomycetota bacterium]|nr:methyltransferase domain-containing protein [Planctomycetota bacterium]